MTRARFVGETHPDEIAFGVPFARFDSLERAAGIVVSDAGSAVIERRPPGAAIYGRSTLAVYDALVLGFSNARAWRVPTTELLAMYNEHISADHLDIGPGSGYFLDRCAFPATPRLTLLDANAAALKFAATRLKRYAPILLEADVLQALPESLGRFDSIALNYVLHCLPGAIRTKGELFVRLAAHLQPGGRVFGATILAHGVSHTALGRALLRVYNASGVFSNRSDSLDELRAALTRAFVAHRLAVAGSVALFVGFNERAPGQ